MRIIENHKNKIISLVFICTVAIICLISYLNLPKDNTVYANEECLCETEEKTIPHEFYVDIKGAVKNPGVYLVNENNIIKDIIDMAGGLSKNATTSNINLSEKVKSEMVIIVNTKSELTTKKTTTSTTNSNNTICTTRVINSCDDEKEENKLININTASKEELMKIPNIGESKADSIIIYRNENRFNKIEDIINVNGIGEALFVKIKDYITV